MAEQNPPSADFSVVSDVPSEDVDETLFVVAVSAGGLADKAGVLPGMSLIGFGQQHVDTTPKIKNAYLQWTVVRKMAASTAL